MIFDPSDIKLASRLETAIIVVSRILFEDPIMSTKAVFGTAISSLLDQGFSRDDLHRLLDEILTVYPSISAECRRALMHSVESK